MGKFNNSALRRTYWDGRAYKRTKIYQPGHNFKFGDVVRFDSSTETFVLASAHDGVSAEAIGIVTVSGMDINGTDEYYQRVHPAVRVGETKDYFSVTFRGEISIPYDDELLHATNSFLSRYKAGNVYFLDPNEPGKLTPTRPETFTGDVIKPMLVALDDPFTKGTKGGGRAIVVNYIGRHLVSDAEEDVTSRYHEFQNVGDIHAVIGSEAVSDDFVYCDGRLLNGDTYPELFRVLEDRVQVKAHSKRTGNNFRLEFTADVSSAIAGSHLMVSVVGTTTTHACTVNKLVSSTELEVVTDTPSIFPNGQDVHVQGHSGHMKRTFFVPDLRDRVLLGVTGTANFGQLGGDDSATIGVGTDIKAGSDFAKDGINNEQYGFIVNFYIRHKTSLCGDKLLTCCEDVSSIEDYRNLAINGDFQVWQRGDEFPLGYTDTASFTEDWVDTCRPQYTADRWYRGYQIKCEKIGGVKKKRFGFVSPVSPEIKHYARVGGWSKDMVDRTGAPLINQPIGDGEEGDGRGLNEGGSCPPDPETSCCTLTMTCSNSTCCMDYLGFAYGGEDCPENIEQRCGCCDPNGPGNPIRIPGSNYTAYCGCGGNDLGPCACDAYDSSDDCTWRDPDGTEYDVPCELFACCPTPSWVTTPTTTTDAPSSTTSSTTPEPNTTTSLTTPATTTPGPDANGACCVNCDSASPDCYDDVSPSDCDAFGGCYHNPGKTCAESLPDHFPTIRIFISLFSC